MVTATGALQHYLQLAAAKIPLGRSFCLAKDNLQHDLTTGHRWPNSFFWPQAVAATVIVKGCVESWLVWKCHSLSFSAHSVGPFSWKHTWGQLRCPRLSNPTSITAGSKSSVDLVSCLQNLLLRYTRAFCTASTPLFKKLIMTQTEFCQSKSRYLQCRHLYELVNISVDYTMTKSIEI